jgi:hypothetical protein
MREVVVFAMAAERVGDAVDADAGASPDDRR